MKPLLMMKLAPAAMALAGALFAGALTALPASSKAIAQSGAVQIELTPAAKNPKSPEMGNWLHFTTKIRNNTGKPIEGVIGWISLLRIDAGHEAPVDLEDWSAHKAITIKSLKPGEVQTEDWPMRLIQAGKYRIFVSAASSATPEPSASNPIDFRVRQKPVVESARVLPVAIGIPLLLLGGLYWRTRRRG